jgi:putative ABC transport system ATP-binding protein
VGTQRQVSVRAFRWRAAAGGDCKGDRQEPALLLCDEPTGALDYENAKRVLGLLETVNRKYGTTILIATHNTAIARMSHKIIRLRSGELIEYAVNEAPVSAEEVAW